MNFIYSLAIFIIFCCLPAATYSSEATGTVTQSPQTVALSEVHVSSQAATPVSMLRTTAPQTKEETVGVFVLPAGASIVPMGSEDLMTFGHARSTSQSETREVVSGDQSQSPSQNLTTLDQSVNKQRESSVSIVLTPAPIDGDPTKLQKRESKILTADEIERMNEAQRKKEIEEEKQGQRAPRPKVVLNIRSRTVSPRNISKFEKALAIATQQNGNRSTAPGDFASMAAEALIGKQVEINSELQPSQVTPRDKLRRAVYRRILNRRLTKRKSLTLLPQYSEDRKEAVSTPTLVHPEDGEQRKFTTSSLKLDITDTPPVATVFKSSPALPYRQIPITQQDLDAAQQDINDAANSNRKPYLNGCREHSRKDQDTSPSNSSSGTSQNNKLPTPPKDSQRPSISKNKVSKQRHTSQAQHDAPLDTARSHYSPHANTTDTLFIGLGPKARRTSSSQSASNNLATQSPSKVSQKHPNSPHAKNDASEPRRRFDFVRNAPPVVGKGDQTLNANYPFSPSTAEENASPEYGTPLPLSAEMERIVQERERIAAAKAVEDYIRREQQAKAEQAEALRVQILSKQQGSRGLVSSPVVKTHTVGKARYIQHADSTDNVHHDPAKFPAPVLGAYQSSSIPNAGLTSLDQRKQMYQRGESTSGIPTVHYPPSAANSPRAISKVAKTGAAASTHKRKHRRRGSTSGTFDVEPKDMKHPSSARIIAFDIAKNAIAREQAEAAARLPRQVGGSLSVPPDYTPSFCERFFPCFY